MSTEPRDRLPPDPLAPDPLAQDQLAQDQFARRTRAVLEDSTSRLDGRVRSRLTQARHRALAELSARRAQPSWRRWLALPALAPAGGVAAVAVLAVVLWTGQRGADVGMLVSATDSGSAFEDLEILADADGPDLTEDADPDFYEWAMLQTGSPGGDGEIVGT